MRPNALRCTLGIAVGTLGLAVASLGAGSPAIRSSADADITTYLARQRAAMVRVTGKPHFVQLTGLEDCRSPVGPAGGTPHNGHWIDVSVSPAGSKVLRSGKGTYPVGTYLLKAKYLESGRKKTDFFTGMRKRSKGYNPEVGDWEFFTLDRSGSTVTARGKIESCVGCHKQYPATDFVARTYLAAPVGRATRRSYND